MKNINRISQFTRRVLLASLVILTTFSIAEAQRGGSRGGGSRGGSSGGGGRSFGGGSARINSGGGGRSFGGFSGGNSRISSAPRGGFGGGNRIASLPGRSSGSFRAGISIRSGYSFRGNYGRPYYHGSYGRSYYGGFGRPYYGGYGAYYRGYFPRIGFHLNVLPFGYYPFSYGGYPYYYNEGLFYQQYNDGYQVVAPPIGADVPRLPRGTQEITIDGQQYFEKDGIYYQPVVDENGKKVYRVTGKDGVLNTDDGTQQYDPQDQTDQPQQYNNNNNNSRAPLPRVGDVVNTIPSESRAVTINGEKLFVSPDGVYYQEDNSGSSRIFKVVGVPTEDSDADTN